jgi:hypothetical protein
MTTEWPQERHSNAVEKATAWIFFEHHRDNDGNLLRSFSAIFKRFEEGDPIIAVSETFKNDTPERIWNDFVQHFGMEEISTVKGIIADVPGKPEQVMYFRVTQNFDTPFTGEITHQEAGIDEV